MLNMKDCDQLIVNLLDVTDVANYKKCSHASYNIINTMNIPMEAFCYECQSNRPMYEMQVYPCSVCNGRKCTKLHGINSKCTTCDKYVCGDCSAFGLCCN